MLLPDRKELGPGIWQGQAWTIEGNRVFNWVEASPLEGRKGYLQASATRIESLLSNWPPEASLSRESLLEKALKLTLGTLGHQLLAISGAAVFAAGGVTHKRRKWRPVDLRTVLPTTNENDLIRIAGKLNRLPNKTLSAREDYHQLWKLIVNEAFKDSPFTDTIPLGLIFPESQDKLPTPKEIVDRWREEELDEMGLTIADACYRLQRGREIVPEYLPRSPYRPRLETSCLLFIKIPGDEPVKIKVPLRIDALLTYLSRKDKSDGRQLVVDAKFRIPLKHSSSIPRRGSPEAPIAPQLYLLAAEKIRPCSSWRPGEIRMITLEPEDFDSSWVEKRRIIDGLRGEHFPPQFYFRRIDAGAGEIRHELLRLPPLWREDLLNRLRVAQKKIKAGQKRW